MNRHFDTQQVPPYPLAQRNHRRQVWWQIIFPILLAGVVFITLSVLAAWGTNSREQVAQWGNISTVVVVFPALGLLFVTLMVFAVLIFGIGKLLKVLPGFLHLAQSKIDQVGLALQRFSDKAASPVIATSSSWAGLKRLFQRR